MCTLYMRMRLTPRPGYSKQPVPSWIQLYSPLTTLIVLIITHIYYTQMWDSDI